MKKIVNKAPKYLLLIQGIPYICMFLEMIELILESNIFKMNINFLYLHILSDVRKSSILAGSREKRLEKV